MDDFFRFFKKDDPAPPKYNRATRAKNHSESLQKRVNVLEKENRTLKSQNFEMENQIRDLNRTVSHYKMIQSTNPQSMKAMQEELVQELKFEIKTQCAQLRNLKESKEYYQTECNQLNQKYQILLNDFESARADSQLEITRLQSLVAKLKNGETRELYTQRERMSESKDRRPKTMTSEQQNQRLIESSEDFYIEEVESMPEKDREIMNLKAEITNLQLLIVNSAKGNSGISAPVFQVSSTKSQTQKPADNSNPPHMDAKLFRGAILEGKRQGFGLAIDADCQVSVGRFERGKLNGFAKLLIDDQMVVGNFVNGKIDESTCKIITFPVLKRTKLNQLMDYEGETIGGVISGAGRLFFGPTSYFEGFFKKGAIDTTRIGVLHVETSTGTIDTNVSVLYFAALDTVVFSSANGLTFACNMKTGILERHSQACD